MATYRRDVSSGMVHEVDDEGRTHEADNLDQAGAYEVITFEEFQHTLPALRCKRCFPTFADPDVAAGTGEERY
jgi:hypothetical protein